MNSRPSSTSSSASSADKPSAARSANMRAVRGKDTLPEMIVRRTVHALGFRFRLHDRKLPGCPDLVLKRHKTVIFVHGCFWHGHQGCRRSRVPATNTDFWTEKLERNVARDARQQAALRADRWHVLVIWECELRDLDAVKDRLTTSIPQRVPVRL